AAGGRDGRAGAGAAAGDLGQRAAFEGRRGAVVEVPGARPRHLADARAPPLRWARMSGTPPGTTEVRPVGRRRVAQRRRGLRRLTLAQAGFTLLAAAVLAGLVLLGWRSAMRITGGRDEVVTDPTAPGYVAEVLPTAVTLVAVTGDAGELIS